MKNANIKVLVSDYDGTYYTSEYSIRKNNYEVQKFIKNNNIFIIATGRSYTSFLRQKEMYNIYYDYLIFNHGAYIVDKNNKVYKTFPFNKTSLKETLNIVKNDNLTYINFYSGFNVVKENESSIDKVLVSYKTDYDTDNMYEELISKLNDKINVYYAGGNYLEIVDKSADKSYALKELLNILNIDSNIIYTVGDGKTDVKMIKDYNGIAMKNGCNEAKEVCKKQIDELYDLIDEII